MPINFKKWIEENRHCLKPPVGNKMIWKDREFIAMVVGGPNFRKDYHINQGEEFFYQIEGKMVLKIRNRDGQFEDIEIKEGEIYLLPRNVPHSPQRYENTIGLVIERQRRPEEKDALVWYCDNCKNVLFQDTFHLTDIETQIKGGIEKFYSDACNYTCKKCGHVSNR